MKMKPIYFFITSIFLNLLMQNNLYTNQIPFIEGKPFIPPEVSEVQIPGTIFFKMGEGIRYGIRKTPVSSGNIRCAVLLGGFSDMQFNSDAEYFKEMFFREPSSTPILYKSGSMNEFYQEMSNGMFSISGDVYGPFTVKNTHDCYGNGSCNDGYCPTNYSGGGLCKGALNFVNDVVLIADKDVNFSKYDNDGDGVVDCLLVAHSGLGGEQNCFGNIASCTDIWSLQHCFTRAGYSSLSTDDGVNIDCFVVGPEKQEYPEQGNIEMGVYSHEFAHMTFDLPDLYDTDFSSCGVGPYSLMGYGVHGASPNHLSAFEKIRLGWAKIIEIKEPKCSIEIDPIYFSGDVYKFWKSGEEKGTEYYLMEYRMSYGFDKEFKGATTDSGLFIWHIDETVLNNNNDEWYPGKPSSKHYRIAFLQADGKYELEKMYGESYPTICTKVDDADFYIEGREFTETTNPSSTYYNGTPLNIEVVNIKNPTLSAGSFTFTFNYGDVKFEMPIVRSEPPLEAYVGEIYEYKAIIDGYPKPDVRVNGPSGVEYTNDFGLRWYPEASTDNAGFEITAENCVGKTTQKWSVNIKKSKLIAKGSTSFCVISKGYKDNSQKFPIMFLTIVFYLILLRIKKNLKSIKIKI